MTAIASPAIHNFVGGTWTDPASGRRADLINPSTGEAFDAMPFLDRLRDRGEEWHIAER